VTDLPAEVLAEEACDQAQRKENSRHDRQLLDVMDRHFVPPITMGALVVDALNGLATDAALIDAHLMVAHPERHIDDFAGAGADVITIHAEATPHVHYALSAVRDAGCRSGLALCPATPVEAVRDVAGELDLALCMTVNPGWGGQAFLGHSIGRLRSLRALVGADVAIEMDGGIDGETAPRCARAGATVFVAGTSVFEAADPATAIRDLQAAFGEIQEVT
jgi:ribulose-phosphate 3-epimerase